MFASATASPFLSPRDTPMLTPLDSTSPCESPLHSRSHSPTSASASASARVRSDSRSSRQPGAGGNNGVTTMNGGSGRFAGIDMSARPSATTGLYQMGAASPATAAGYSGSQPETPHGRIVFHSGGQSHYLNDFGGDSGEHSSRSGSGRASPGLGGIGSGLFVTTHGFDHLCAYAEVLAHGIVTSHEVKKKDAAGRVFQNCFTGKEALNCLRHKLPRGSSASTDTMPLLQQLLQEGFLVEAQSVDELNRQIAAKFAPAGNGTDSQRGTSSAVSSARSSPKLPTNTLAFKVPSGIGGAASPSPPAPLFRKDGMYQLTPLWKSGAGNGNGSASNSNCTSPTPGASSSGLPAPMSQWFANFSGYLGKKRENKGIGNSLALGLGVSAFQRRFFQCSAREQAVVYFKDDPSLAGGGYGARPGASNSTSGDDASFPLGFIPFSEILFVEHLASAASQLKLQASLTAGLSKNGSFTKGSKSAPGSGSSTPAQVPAGVSSAEEKAGRFFDIVASFRVYHLQAETSMEAMKWVQAIKESVREATMRRADRLLGGSAQAALNSAAGSHQTLRAALVRTPRTPNYSKRFWSNAARATVNPRSFPSQALKHALRDDTRDACNGLYARHVRPARVSDLRRTFFDLFFSVSSLDQACGFDLLLEEFDADTKIVELCWNVVMRGAGQEMEMNGPRSFRPATQVHAGAGGVPFVSPSHEPIFVPTLGGGSSNSGAARRYVDTSASDALLTKWHEDEMAEYLEEDGSVTTSTLPPSRGRLRRSISCGTLPDSTGRPRLPRPQPRVRTEQDILRESHSRTPDSEYSRSSSVSRSTSGYGNYGGRRTRRSRHRRCHTDICPLSRGVTGGAGKFGDFPYYLLNKYALYHAASCKLPAFNSAAPSAAAAPSTQLSAPFLYRILHPYRRLESWLHTDAFLNLLLNDESLINEVPLTLPLVWLVLQWRNHDADGDGHSSSDHSGTGAGKHNWLDEAVDGEEDGFTGPTAGQEEEESTAAQGRANGAAGGKSGVKSRAHLRVHSFSTMADPLSAIRPAAQSVAPASPPPPPPSSLSHQGGSTPVVYGAHGQVIGGARGTSPHTYMFGHGAPSSPNLNALSVQSPSSPSGLSDYGSGGHGPDGSPTPSSPMMFDANPSPSPAPPTYHRATSRGVPPIPLSPPLHSLHSAPGTPNMSPQPMLVRHWSVGASASHAAAAHASALTEERLHSGSSSDLEPGATGERAKSNSESSCGSDASSVVGSLGVFGASQPSASPLGGASSSSAPATRRNSFVHSSARRALDLSGISLTNPSSATGGSVTAPSSKRGSLETGATVSGLGARSGSGTNLAAMPPTHAHGNTRQRDRATIVQTASSTLRSPVNLLTSGGGGGGGYTTLRPGYSTATSPIAPPIPSDLPHWKVRSLVACRHCMQTSLEFMQAIAERYGMDAGREEHRRACQAAAAAGREAPRAHPESKFTICVANTLFSLLLTPLYSLPALSSSDYLAAQNPVLQDSFNVLGKVILSPHIWPTLLACLQSNQVTASRDSAPFLKHHVLKDMNTLFIGTNLSVNNRNCRLIFKYFAHVAREERKPAEEAIAEREREKRMNAKDRARAERRRRRNAPRILIGAWQTGLLNLLRNHVPARGGRYPHVGDAGIERLHSKIYQYVLNLFGVFHFYKFQCIGSAVPTNIRVSSPASKNSTAAMATTTTSHTSCEDFKRLFKESFWRSMNLHRAAYAQEKEEAAEALKEKEDSAARSSASSNSSAASSGRKMAPPAKKHVVGPRSASDMRLLDHTVARSMLMTMLQRLIFKIKAKTCSLEQRWPAVAFLVQLVKSFTFSTPLRSCGPSSSPSSSPASSTGISDEALLGFALDFGAHQESLHVGGLVDDIDLLEKALELVRSMRLYQELDADQLSLQKQKEIKMHVEKEAATNKGRMADIHDASSKLKLNAAHEDLAQVYSHLLPSDQASLKYLQQQVPFLKDSVCFLAMMDAARDRGAARHMDAKDVGALVANFVTMDRREKVFCTTK